MKKLFSVMLSLIFFLGVLPMPEADAAAATLTVNFAQKQGAVRHGSCGFLYGLGSSNIPEESLITPLKPATAVQKAPDGMQHPTGDVLDVAETFIDAGGEAVQIYLQDIYALWPYEYTTFDDYLSRISEAVPKIAALRGSNPAFSGKIVYIPFNEPDGIWYNNINSSASVQSTFNQNWQAAYELIRSLDPDALIGGVSFASYQANAMESWIKFCSENGCEPDCVTWHELQTDKLSSFKSHLEHYRSLEKKYGLSEREVIINEYAPQDHCSVPGKLVNWIALFEENKVSACLPYWHNAGNLNDIAAGCNEPNGAWWLYKWYADMSGETVEVSTSTDRSLLYGLASADDIKKSACVLFGGVSGSADIVLENLDQTASFGSAVDIKVEATYWSAFHGSAPEPSVVLSGTYPVADGKVTVSFDNMDAYAAYRLTVTEASDPSRAGAVYRGAERITYEAENASYLGNVYGNSTPWTYAYSGGKRLSGIKTYSDGYDLSFSVPRSGCYRTDIIYGNGFGLNTSDPARSNPQTLKASVRIDGGEEKIILLENTLRDQMQGMYTDYFYLTESKHTLHVRGCTENEGDFSNDCVSFTYCGASQPVFNSVFEAEEADFNVLNGCEASLVKTENSLSGFSASGYVTGLSARSVPDGGGVRFVVSAPENALYSLTFRCSAEESGSLSVYLGNSALSLDNILTELPVCETNGFSDFSTTAFLKKGINIIDVSASSEIALDCLRVRKASFDDAITVQAEDCTLSGNAQTASSPYADGNLYVTNIEGGTDDSLTLTVTAPESGQYKMTVYYSFGSLFGAHTYNAQLVDRFASFSVNGDEGERVYFQNTFSDENWRTRVLDVKLKKGGNTIKIYNDNWRTLTCGTGTSGNITYQSLVNYAPNFDKFLFTPAISDADAQTDGFSVTFLASDGGKVELDKSYTSYGENVTLTIEKEYVNGSVEVLANGEDVSSFVRDGKLTYAVTGDTEFRVRFLTPENIDNIIANSSFGTGDLSGWSGDAEVENDAHFAALGSLSQKIFIPDGYYTVTFRAQGSSLSVSAGAKEQTFDLTEEWRTYSVRALSQNGSFTLALSGDAKVDDFRLLTHSVDENLLYFVDCGDTDPTTLSEGDAFGIYNSVTEQFFAPDPATGAEWGICDEYTPSEKFPDLLTGKETWPYEYDLTDGRSKLLSFRYAKDQPDYGQGSGITYKFSLPDGDYSFEVGFCAPEDWMASVSRKAILTVNGQTVAEGIIPRTDEENPVIVKASAPISGGFATLNLNLTSDGVGGPVINYIKISPALPEPEITRLNPSSFTVSGSATWNNDPSTAAKYAFDKDASTYFDGISGGWLVADLGASVKIGAIGFVPRASWEGRMTASAFYASNDGCNWEKLFVIPSPPEYNTEKLVSSSDFLTPNCRFRYIKYQNTYDYCNVSEISVYKEQGSLAFAALSPALTLELTGEDEEYAFSFTGGKNAALLRAKEDDGIITSVKREPLPESGFFTFSKGEKVYIWDVKTLTPLALFDE